jgi:hypothetical protein
MLVGSLKFPIYYTSDPASLRVNKTIDYPEISMIEIKGVQMRRRRTKRADHIVYFKEFALWSPRKLVRRRCRRCAAVRIHFEELTLV